MQVFEYGGELASLRLVSNLLDVHFDGSVGPAPDHDRAFREQVFGYIELHARASQHRRRKKKDGASEGPVPNNVCASFVVGSPISNMLLFDRCYACNLHQSCSESSACVFRYRCHPTRVVHTLMGFSGDVDAKVRHIADWRNLFEIVNGSWQTDRIIHICSSSKCCNNYSRPHTIYKVVYGLLRTVFSEQPGSPELGKWTKYGPALDKVVLGSCAFDVYASAFRLSFGKDTGGGPDVGAQTEDDSFMQEMRWQEVKSKRAKVSTKLLDDPYNKIRFVILAMASEPLRILMRCFFVYARADETHECCPTRSLPPMCHFSTESFSPVASMLQYCSGFLTMRSSPRIQNTSCSHQHFWVTQKDRCFHLNFNPSSATSHQSMPYQ